jgi:hypothetical protein
VIPNPKGWGFRKAFGNPFEVEILWVRPYKGSTEKYWYATLKGMELHHQGEWFKEPDDMGMFFK